MDVKHINIKGVSFIWSRGKMVVTLQNDYL